MEEVDAKFLPLVYDILKGIDKDGDITPKATELKAKLQKAREQVEKLPGTDYSPEEQQRKIEVLQKQLETKTELLRKYKNLCNFDLK